MQTCSWLLAVHSVKAQSVLFTVTLNEQPEQYLRVLLQVLVSYYIYCVLTKVLNHLYLCKEGWSFTGI